MKRLAVLVLLLPALVSAAGISTGDTSRRALSKAMEELDDAQRERFASGRGLFDQMWVIAPSTDEAVDGLGPVYNRISCVACHPGNGRGRAPDAESEEMRSMLVRLSIPGVGEHGGPLPHPAYGEQLNEQGVPGVPGEGRIAVKYQDIPLFLHGGTGVTLRKPSLVWREAHYGTPDGVLTSARIGPALVGMGLLEAVPEAEILKWADPDDKNQDGISGRANTVWDAAVQQNALGRFGLKANVATLRQQIAGAFIGDLGITSPLFPHENCSMAETACARTVNGGNPELSAVQLDDITFYHQTLAIPERRQRDTAQVQRGQQLFQQAQCAACHRPMLYTAANAKPDLLSQRIIEPYSDLLLHDMGEPLADGRPDFAANGYEWRTPPLWGIGLAEAVGDQVHYLHDGRARNLLEAIVWHRGEAAASQQAVWAMTVEDREALLAFLRSL
ncbi:di-heme oxidoreductase family protein [Thiothrix subterranea]|uniref:di-heme oxidoreductase family protein n=1 Tax=Thiothrix subterranea TaxID=2735563 RepID=UPI00192AA7B9|nr:di-heme oxidoredictase family protein [Thiothrix subterranea]